MKKLIPISLAFVPFLLFAQADFLPFLGNFDRFEFRFTNDTLFRQSQKYPILTERKEQTLGGDQQVYTFVNANGLQAFIYQDGNQLAQVLQFAKLKEKKFLKYNDLEPEPVLKIGQVYYLENKKSKAGVAKGYIKDSESFWEFSQRFAIHLSDLRKYNVVGEYEPANKNREMWLQGKRPATEPIRIYDEPIEEIIEKNTETANEVTENTQEMDTVSVPPLSERTEKTEVPSPETTSEDTSKTVVEDKNSLFLKPNNQSNNKTVLANTAISQANGYHVIQKGETLSQISKDYNISLASLMKMNNLTNKSVIKAGQKLKLRPTALASSKTKTTAQKTTSKEGKGKTVAQKTAKKGEKTQKMAKDAPAARRLPDFHTVTKEGETTTSIAVKYGLLEDDLTKWNFLHTNQTLPLKCRVYLHPPTDQVPPAHHVLQKGENIYILSRKYNIEVKKLLEWNNIDRLSNAVTAGTKIKLYETEDAALAAIEQAKLTAQKRKEEEQNSGTQAQNKSNYLPSPLSMTLDVTNETLDMQPLEEETPVNSQKGQTTDNQTNTDTKKTVSSSESNMSDNMLLPEVYTVGRNMESLEEISEKYLISVSDLRKYNPDIPNNLAKGTKVYLKPRNEVKKPDGSGLLDMTHDVTKPAEQKETPKETPKPQETGNSEAVYDIPQFGESLGTVAKRLGTTLEALLKLNPDLTEAFSGDGATKIRVK